MIEMFPGFWLFAADACLGIAIVGLLVFAGVFAPVFNTRSGSFLPMWIGGAGFAVFIVFAVLYGFCVSQRPYTMQPEHSWNTTEIQNITSLSDGQAYSMGGGGSFFLGSGSISVSGSTRPQYVFYKVMPQGYQLGTIDASGVFIRMDEQRYPYIEWDYRHTRLPKKVWIDNGEVDYVNNGAESSIITATIIHVPNGTVVKEYKLDGELK